MSKKHRGHIKGDPVTYQTPLPAGGVQLETFIPWTRRRNFCPRPRGSGTPGPLRRTQL